MFDDTPVVDRNINLSNFDFDPSDEEVKNDSEREVSPRESPVDLSSGESHDESPILNSKRLSGLNASILLNSASRKRKIPDKSQNVTPSRHYRRYSRPKNIDSDSSFEIDVSYAVKKALVVNEKPIEICSSPDEVRVQQSFYKCFQQSLIPYQLKRVETRPRPLQLDQKRKLPILEVFNNDHCHTIQ